MPELKYAHEICSKLIVRARVVSSTMQREWLWDQRHLSR